MAALTGVRFDLFDEGAEADFDAGRNRRNGRRKYRRDRFARGAGVDSAANQIFPDGPLLAGISHQFLDGQGVAEVIGVRRLRVGHGFHEIEDGGVAGDGVFEGLELVGKAIVAGAEVTGSGHNLIGSNVFELGLRFSVKKWRVGMIAARVATLDACAGTIGACVATVGARAGIAAACAGMADARGWTIRSRRGDDSSVRREHCRVRGESRRVPRKHSSARKNDRSAPKNRRQSARGKWWGIP